MKKILVTGGAGYIGSHACVELLDSDYEILVLDNLSNSCEESLNRVKQITGKDFKFEKVDLTDRNEVERVFAENDIEAVIHFAGLKAVGESVAKPIEYYTNNIYGTLILLDVMKKYNVKKIAFSSSATVYGKPEIVPITENMPLSTTNPYGSTKLMIENILQDVYVSDNTWSISILRYFNPIGAHKSGLIGENPNGVPNNLMPYIAGVASGKFEKLSVFGDDYETHDGTGVRDYIHVVDLAKGHIKAIEYINDKSGVFIHNLGTGVGYSVLDLVKAFERVNNITIPYSICPRRPGDIDECYSNPKKAEDELHWVAKLTIDDMCRDAWNFQSNNPNGYDK